MTTNRNPNKIILLLLLVLAANCCGGRKLSDHPRPLGVVPFASDAIAGSNADLNRRLLQALHSRGSFRVQLIQKESALLNLEQIESRFGRRATVGDSLGAADSLAAAGQALPRFLLTGVFLKEIEYEKRGQLLPFLLYAPSYRMEAELEFRLYDRRERRWIAIQNIKAEVKRSGGKQVMEYDSSHPSLAVSAPERQQLRQQLYRQLFARLAKAIEKVISK